MEELKKKIEKLLLKVQRPSRYIGGEVGSVVKDKDKVDVRFAFCFPDTYEVGMSHLGMKILYGLKTPMKTGGASVFLCLRRTITSSCVRTISLFMHWRALTL